MMLIESFRQIEYYMNLREDLKIAFKEENEKEKIKRFDKYLKEVIESYSDDE